MKVIYSPEAELDIDDIWLYIAADNQLKATELINTIKKTCIFLAENPEAGTEREYLKQGLRHFSIKNRAIYYKIKNNDIEIVRILHGSRDVKKHF
jgi:toxin ParE1/3/4